MGATAMDNPAREEAAQRKRIEKTAKRQLIVIWSIFLVCFTGVAVHIYMLQTAEAEEHLRARSERQSAGSMTLGAGGESELDGHRGYIYDRNGFELAISVETPSVFVHPRKIVNKGKAAVELSKALEMDLGAVRQVLDKDVSFAWLVRKTTPEKGAAVKALNIHGVGTKRESKRYYPGQELAGQIIGFAGIDNVGLEGLEATYDKNLRGSVLKVHGTRDARNHMILMTDAPRLNDLEGSSLVLTLDQYIQKVAETALERVSKKFSAKSAVAVVLDPHTGEVLAMANWPRFNPNRYRDYDKDAMRNRAVLDAYEPGSMMKLITYASAVDGARVRPNDPVSQDHGKLKIGKHTISDTHAIPNMTAELVVSESSNIGAYHLAQKLGKEGFYNYLKSFGFGRKTGIGLHGESAGILWNYTKWAEVMFANIAFGHGISVSPIQLATAVGAIANGGKMMRPWLIREIRDVDGDIIEQGSPQEIAKVIEDKSAQTVMRAMERVVAEGTGMRAWVKGYRVGGKTGTAQKIDPKTRTYGHEYMANFVGIAPIDDPNVVVVVMVDAPRPQHSGGFVAAPVFAEIVSQILPYRGVYPKSVDDGIADPFDKEAYRAAARRAADAPPIVAPHRPESCPQTVTVPDFAGMTAYHALQFAKANCLGANILHAGYVTAQWPPSGSTVSAHTRVELTMANYYK